ncbi:MAG: UV DNA damage repair endonuclease UvsE [Chlamydiota bacterium]
MIRLGLCCIFSEEPIKFRTTTAAYLSRIDQPYAYLSQIIADNIAALKQSLAYCARHGIGCFRLSSKFFPLCSHPDWKYQLEDLPNGAFLLDGLKACRKDKEAYGLRLTIHPDQFIVLNSPKDEVVTHAIAELTYHARLADAVGIDVINLHGGGVYGDKQTALNRFKATYCQLPQAIQSRLTLENDDKSYTPADLLPLCAQLNIPFVYDVHHHRCLPDDLSIEEATARAIQTWNREPLVHLSSPREGWEGPKPHRHHDMIAIHDFPPCWENLSPLTVEVEAKLKEVAIADLRKSLIQKNLPLWQAINLS